MNPTALFILGMHRSGTSALARVVNLLGADLGGDEVLMQGSVDNPKGFFEHEEVVEIHEALLMGLGSNWREGLPLPQGWVDSAAAQKAQRQLGEVIDRDFSGKPLWAIKDPRISRLYPLWLPLLEARGIVPKALIGWRQPQEVAASLDKRDKMPKAQALLCWLAYSLDSLGAAQHMPVAVIGYDALLTDWQVSLTQAAKKIAVEWPISPAIAAPEVAGFLSPNLRHHKAQAATAAEPLATGLQAMVMDIVALYQAGGGDAKSYAALQQRWETYCLPLVEQLAPLQEALNQTEQQRYHFKAEASKARHALEDTQQQMAHLQSLYDDLHRQTQPALEAQQQRDAMLASLSWRLTCPLRRVRKFLP